MAISQADFYAFSQATGAPVPEDPESRARIAPQVMEWRRNQLKQPKEEGGIVDTLGKIALGAGTLAAGIAGFRALRGRSAAAPAAAVVQEAPVRRAAQPIPQQRVASVPTVTSAAAQPARPPIPRPPTQSFAQPKTSLDPWSGKTTITDPFGVGTVPQVVRPQPQTGIVRALPPAEEEFVPYRPDPKDPAFQTRFAVPQISEAVQEARRKAATASLVEASRRTGAYQPELPGIKGTLMALRSPAGVSAEEVGELIPQAESRPLSIAPAQQNLFKYVQQAAEPEGDAVDRLILEYEQLVESQARADRRAQASVRQYQMEVQGKAMRVLDELRKETPQLTVGQRLAKVGAGMSGVPKEWEGGTGIGLNLESLGFQDVELSSPAAQRALSKAGVTEQEAVEYWTQKLNTMVENQQAKQAFNVDQAINALESGEDQMTGRMRQQLQRNEGTNLSVVDQIEDATGSIDVAASMTPDGVPIDQAESAGRIDELVEKGKRYLRAQEIDLDYDYGPENRRQTAQVNERIARAQQLKDTAEQIILEERGEVRPIDVARTRSADERRKLAAQGFAGERLEQQLLENMRANFPEGREVMAPLQEETRRIERVGMPSQIEVRENIGSVIPPRQGDPERVGKAASQQAGYEGGIRGMSRVDYGLSTRNPSTGEYEELGGGIGVYGLEPKYAAGAVRRRGEFGESDYGDLGYEYSAAAERRPTELTGKPGLEELRDPYSRLSDDQLGELSMYGSDVDKYNAQQQLKKRASVDVTRELRRLQLSNEPGAAENFLTRFKQGLI